MSQRNLTPFQRVVVSISFLTCLGATLWGIAKTARTQGLRELYALASGGDLDSVRRISEYPSTEATTWLTALAYDRTATADSRVAAIAALESTASFDPGFLVSLISIDQPFDVRHAAAEVLERRGCDERCISGTLQALHSLYEGRPGFEAGLSEVQRLPPELNTQTAKLRIQTERDYWTMLNASPCLTARVLRTQHGLGRTFIDQVQSKVSPCR